MLAKPDRFELLLINPSPPSIESQAEKELPHFHDYKETARRELSGPADRAQIVALIQQGIANNHGQAAACFNPRRSIHATAGDKTVDLLICYECGSIEIYDAQNVIASRLTDASVASAIQAAFQKAGIRE